MEYGHFKRRDQGGFRDRNDNRGNDRNDNRGGFRDRNDNRDRGGFDRDRSNDRDRGGFDRDRGGFRGGGFDRNRGGGYDRERGGGGFDRDNEESVFSKRVRAGKRRTYFFDVKKTKGEDYFITITESTRREDGYGYKRHKIFLYKEDFNRFVASLNEVVTHVKTDLMPDFDYEEFDRRQAEWEAQNRDQDDDERGGGFRPRGEFRAKQEEREDREDDEVEDVAGDDQDELDMDVDIRDERDDDDDVDTGDKKSKSKDDDDVNW